MTSANMDSTTSFSALHGSSTVVPLSKTDVHPLEMLGSSNKNLTLNTDSASGASILSSSTWPSRRRSISDSDRYMLMADQRQSVSERSLASTTSSTMPKRRSSLDAQCVAELKVQLAEHQAQTDETALLILQLNADKDDLRAARDKALEKCKQLECDITRQKKEHEDKISRLEAQLEAQAHELRKIRLERDEMVEEVASRRESMASVVSASAASPSGGGAPPHANRRNTLQAMHERRSSMQQRRSSDDTEGSGGRLTSSASRRGSVTSQGSHTSGRGSVSDLSHHNSATSGTSSMSRQESVRPRRASITESIGEVGASIRDLVAHARDVAGGTASARDLAYQDSLSPEDLLWMSDSSFNNVGDLGDIDISDDVEDPCH